MTTRAPKTGTPRTSVMSVRMAPELRSQVEQAAITAGMSLSAYIADTLAKASLPRVTAPAPTAAPVTIHTAPVAYYPTFTQGGARASFHMPAASMTSPPIPATVRAAHAQPTPQVQPAPANPQPPTRTTPTNGPPIQREQGYAPRPDDHVNMPVNTAVNGRMAQPQPQVPQHAAVTAAPVTAALRLIGTDINRIAHTINSGLPSDSAQLIRALRQVRDLFEIEGVFAAILLDQSATDERGRITNNLNQIAQAGPWRLTPAILELVQGYLAVLAATNTHAVRARLTVVQQWHRTHDTPHPQARQQLQDSGPVRAPRPAPAAPQPRPRPTPTPANGGTSFLGRLLKS